jgi:hypothetical protein
MRPEQELEALVRLLKPVLRLLDKSLSSEGTTRILLNRVQDIEVRPNMRGAVLCDRFTWHEARLVGDRLLLTRSGQLIRQVRRGAIIDGVGSWTARTETLNIRGTVASFPLWEIKAGVRAAILRALASRAEARRKLKLILNSPELSAKD